MKQENDGWHIDGILARESPVYVVELYDYTGGSNQGVLCTISAYGEKSGGVSYEEFKAAMEKALQGTDYNYTEQETDRILLTYQKDGKRYRAVITPKNDEQESPGYHVYPDSKNFGYREITKDIYYLSRMKLEIEEVKETKTSLTLNKTVNGNGANPEEHFTFTLSLDSKGAGLTGSYPAVCHGMEECKESHPATVDFSEGTATFLLKHGEQITIQGLPAGAAGTIVEAADDYQISVTEDGNPVSYGENGLSVALPGQGITLTFANRREQVPVTGFSMDILPCLLLAAGGMTGGAVAILGRRKKKMGNVWKQ